MVRTSHRASSFTRSFYYATQGVVRGFSDERNFRVQCLYGVTVAVLLLWFQPPLLGSALALATVLLLLAAELANSALERVVDLTSPQPCRLAGEAKDMAAGGVMLVSFASAGIVLAVLSSELSGEAIVSLGGLFMVFIVGGRGGKR